MLVRPGGRARASALPPLRGRRPERDHYCRSCGIDVARLAPPPPTGRTVGVWTGPGPHGSTGTSSLALWTAGLRLVLGWWR